MSSFSLRVEHVLLVVTVTIFAVGKCSASPDVLSLSSTSGTAGGSATLSLSLASASGSQPAALEWTLDYPSTEITGVTAVAGPAASATAKSVTCSGNICVVYGLNDNAIQNGIVAYLTVQIAANASGNLSIQLNNVEAATPSGSSTAVSTTDGQISVQSVAISLTPAAASLGPSQTQQFTATVIGTSNTAVNWNMSPSVGTLTTGGLYTAPGTISTTQAVAITATSVADSTKAARAVVTLDPVTPTAGTATFVGVDATTQGNWRGVYGADGYNVVNDTASYPGYVTVTPSGVIPFTWAASTTDARALEKASSSTGRLAATWYNDSSFLIDLAFKDAAQHQVAIYCLDWSSTSRAETIEILDANGAVLNTQTMADFHNGKYLVWQLSGHVQIRFTRAAGFNAVVAGLFFGTGTATFVGVDATTQGNWRGVYGADGYNVVNDTASYPGYVTVTPSGVTPFTWAASTTDVRALEKASSSTGRIAATWYNDSSFLIDLAFKDAAQHQVTIYCLDWSSTSRAETIEILDANGAVLNTQTMADFHNGKYLVWQLSGHVQIRFTRAAGFNAVAAGLFFSR